MAVTQPAWKVGEPSPASGRDMVHYRPATKEEWAAYTHRETPRALPPRVDNATPEHIADLGELWVDEDTGYKARVKPDGAAHDDDDQAAGAGNAAGGRRAKKTE